MNKVKIKTDYITLGQFLKLANAVDSGVTAKFVIQDGLVFVNGEVDTRRGKKLYPGDEVTFEDTTYVVE
ncbi:MAG: S4 domain-containing protein YaaA [Bacilli bacterium]|nr:S4 domain-containing protein YaaA [Bacilli bacterium]